MIPVVLASRDLMTTSRLELVEGLDVAVVGSDGAIDAALAARPDATLVVDLPAFPALLERLAGADALPTHGIVAYAPHIHEELLDTARPYAQLVAPRGATMRALRDQVDRVRLRAGASPTAGDVAE